MTSPNYPNNYKSSSDCTWFITVPRGQRIKFTIFDMEVEYHVTCSYDYVRIGDGSVKGIETRDTICGNKKYEFVSKGDQMWIQFYSDSQVNRKGFKASWTVHMTTTTEKMATTATTIFPELG